MQQVKVDPVHAEGAQADLTVAACTVATASSGVPSRKANCAVPSPMPVMRWSATSIQFLPLCQVRGLTPGLAGNRMP